MKAGDDKRIRDAAEKAWNAIIQATTALLLAKGYAEEEVKTHRQERLALAELGSKDEHVRRLGLGDRFMAREYTLHVRRSYDGEYALEEVKDNVEKAEEYADSLRKIF